jgi:hypothetical protein
MHFNFQLPEQNVLGGFAERSVRPRELGPIRVYEVLTSDVGERLFERLTKIWGVLLPRVPPGTPTPLESDRPSTRDPTPRRST